MGKTTKSVKQEIMYRRASYYEQSRIWAWKNLVVLIDVVQNGNEKICIEGKKNTKNNEIRQTAIKESLSLIL